MRKYRDAVTGDRYDISHLERQVVEYVQHATAKDPERRYRVEVTYSDHCYTKGRPDGGRLFDPERYEQSKQLPKIVAALMSRECHHTGRTNFVTFDIDKTRTYEVYFEVFKRGGLRLRVQSAYIRDAGGAANRPRRAKINFHTILYNVLNDRAIHPPRQKR